MLGLKLIYVSKRGHWSLDPCQQCWLTNDVTFQKGEINLIEIFSGKSGLKEISVALKHVGTSVTLLLIGLSNLNVIQQFRCTLSWRSHDKKFYSISNGCMSDRPRPIDTEIMHSHGGYPVNRHARYGSQSMAEAEPGKQQLWPLRNYVACSELFSHWYQHFRLLWI